MRQKQLSMQTGKERFGFGMTAPRQFSGTQPRTRWGKVWTSLSPNGSVDDTGKAIRKSCKPPSGGTASIYSRFPQFAEMGLAFRWNFRLSSCAMKQANRQE